MAQQELGSWDEAKKDFSQCLTIEPQNKAVQQSLQKLKVMQKKYDDQEKEKYRKMFA